MMETDPDWAPSLHLGHTETIQTDTECFARQNKRAQKKKTARSAEGHGEQHTEETHEDNGEQHTEETHEDNGEQHTEETHEDNGEQHTEETHKERWGKHTEGTQGDKGEQTLRRHTGGKLVSNT
ncbi:hypothetical protein QQF64_018338 [Cirrhinus molitorella]|uniref:Uncharacterized protein n=1 Tax=Cirrhinus molitorella TaxID=172907 RepID=A0ABR3LFT2_9TELE